jgi:hypothetical protein
LAVVGWELLGSSSLLLHTGDWPAVAAVAAVAAVPPALCCILVCVGPQDEMRETSGDAIHFEDLEKLPVDQVAHIAEWLTEKVDALSTRLKAEPREDEVRHTPVWGGGRERPVPLSLQDGPSACRCLLSSTYCSHHSPPSAALLVCPFDQGRCLGRLLLYMPGSRGCVMMQQAMCAGDAGGGGRGANWEAALLCVATLHGVVCPRGVWGGVSCV